MDATQIRQALQAALEGVVSDPAGIAEDLDPTRFVDAAGNLRGDAVRAMVDRHRGGAPARKTSAKERALDEAVRRGWITREEARAKLEEARSRANPTERPGTAKERAAVWSEAKWGKPGPDGKRSGKEQGLAEARRRFGPPKDAA